MKERMAFYTDLLDSMTEPVRVINASGIVIYQNRAMKQIAGEQIGEKCYLLHKGHSQCMNCICQNHLRQEKQIEKTACIGGKTYAIRAAAIKQDPSQMIEVYRDITEQLEKEAILQSQNEKMQRDLDFAHKIQASVLPQNGLYGGLVNLTSYYDPAELLGGDIYDVIEIDDCHIGFYMADVSGHGVTSAMITLFLGQAFKSMGDLLKDPCATLKQLYQRYEELGISEEKYVTVLYGVYDSKRGIIRFSNAGHNCLPIHIDAQGGVTEVNTRGLPICTFFDDIPCSEVVIPATKGHKILLYTDGISEARDDSGAEYGERILCVVHMTKHQETHEICRAIYEDRKLFAKGRQEDDLAIMALEIMA